MQVESASKPELRECHPARNRCVVSLADIEQVQNEKKPFTLR
jgi:hypothetical protein